MTRPRKKAFDCVEMQHRGGALVHERTKHMTFEEEVAYWAERTEALLEKQRRLRAEAAAKEEVVAAKAG